MGGREGAREVKERDGICESPLVSSRLGGAKDPS
jgi:hypothetical protein